MKLTLTPEATQSLKTITERIKAANPYASRHASTVTAQIIQEFERHADKATLLRVADQLVSPRMKRKALLKRLADLSGQGDEVALQVLEKSVRKLDRSSTESSENEAEK